MPGLYTTTTDYTPLPPYGLLLVHLTLDSGVPATFLIDTGTNVSAISRTLALKLGLTPKPAPTGATLLGRQMDVITVPMLKIGDFSLPNIPLVVWEDKELTNLVGHPVDGILAENVLKYFGLMIDFPAHRITLFVPGGLADAIILRYGFMPASGLPVTSPPDDSAYSVSVAFRNGAHIDQENLLVDTGSADTHISPALASRLGLVAEAGTEDYSVLGHVVSDNTATVEAINLGGLEIRDHRVKYLGKQSEGSEPLVLGLDVLGGYRVLLDFPAQKMYVAPPTDVVRSVRIAPAAPAPPGGANSPTQTPGVGKPPQQ